VNLFTLFIIIGFLSVGAMFVIFYFEVWKDTKRKKTSSSIPVFVNHSPLEIAKKMMEYVRKDYFLLHTLVNDAPTFDDRAYLARYKKHMRKSSTVAYIQNLKGWSENNE